MYQTIARRWSPAALMLLMITLTITAEAASLSTEERNPGTEIAESRTFGRIRRLQAMIVPVMFFLGVMKTLLAFLVAISLKSLFVGVSILMINIGLVMAKVIAFFKSKYSYDPHGGHGYGWSDKNIHVHIHNDGQVHHSTLPLEYEQAPPSALHHTAPSVFPSYGPPVLKSYLRSRSDQVADPMYVQSTVATNDQFYPKAIVTDREKLDQIYAQWRQLHQNGR